MTWPTFILGIKKKIHALRTGSILKLSHLACILLRALFSNKCKEFILSLQSGRRCGEKSEIWPSHLMFVTADITCKCLWLACDLAHVPLIKLWWIKERLTVNFTETRGYLQRAISSNDQLILVGWCFLRKMKGTQIVPQNVKHFNDTEC